MDKITYKALGVLLAYPNAELMQALEEISQQLRQENLLSQSSLKNIDQMIAEMKKTDLVTLQERYVATFDQTPPLSLHLFEHIHGESRDRGPAMVDLTNMYQAEGLKTANNELPDYLPAFLEYLSLLPNDDAKKLLKDPIHVVKKIGEQLKSVDNHYHAVFSALEALAV